MAAGAGATSLKTAVLFAVSAITGTMNPHLGLGEGSLLLRDVERRIGDLGASRAHANEPRILVFEVDDDVFHDRASADSPLLCVLVVRVHMPVFQGFEAGPETDFVVPARIVGMHPPCQMQKAGKFLQVVAHVGGHHLKFL
jgi:hypothetical protein